ncbi:hypothetical protein FH972_022537 [Carpinus fangiana]|uniref:Cation/H+ exchanger transmembrane domain-containing protein n=1 Tax=Carpinus fangiana TaxID=176857 RepID=A0A5N6KT34_9ROSI|nr:hypothetical protein FH972_022537 [Carpinus fangiana]
MAVQLGYLGLILLIYEGGLATNFSALKANFLFSSGVALTGIAMPIALSYSLVGLTGASALQAFAAGAALCSTSLGTTFTVMGTTGLISTRMGVVLTSAAMMDDVVGLVMVKVVSNLGDVTQSFSVLTIIRPIFVSVGLAVAIPLTAEFIVKPVTVQLNSLRQKSSNRKMQQFVTMPALSFIVHTMILVGLVAASTYAGSSNLFAAYLVGAAISWWDSEVPHPKIIQSQEASIVRDDPSPEGLSGVQTFERFYAPVLNRILKPFFFASIGFSIPITRMFRGRIIWKGIVYTILMTFAKAICGLWLIRFPCRGGATSIATLIATQPNKRSSPSRLDSTTYMTRISCLWRKRSAASSSTSRSKNKPAVRTDHTRLSEQPASAELSEVTPVRLSEPRIPKAVPLLQSSSSTLKPLSLYPAGIIASAMVARGEIGFLISSLAQSNGIFASPNGSDDIFLIVTWAIMMCTIIGPVVVGALVQRVRRLEAGKASRQGIQGVNVLGVWGVR